MRHPAQQLPLALSGQDGFNLDNLVITKTNAAIFDALASWPDWRESVSVLIGAEHTGKSHMAACWADQARARQFSPNDLDAAIDVAADGVPILIEDMAANNFTETTFFHLLNSVREARLRHQQASLLITSRSHPVDWQVKLADLASRLRAIRLLEMPPPDDLLLRAIVTKLFADRQLRVEPHVIRYSVTRMERSIAAAVRFVAEIDRAALARKSNINIKLASQILTSIKDL